MVLSNLSKGHFLWSFVPIECALWKNSIWLFLCFVVFFSLSPLWLSQWQMVQSDFDVPWHNLCVSCSGLFGHHLYYFSLQNVISFLQSCPGLLAIVIWTFIYLSIFLFSYLNLTRQIPLSPHWVWAWRQPNTCFWTLNLWIICSYSHRNIYLLGDGLIAFTFNMLLIHFFKFLWEFLVSSMFSLIENKTVTTLYVSPKIEDGMLITEHALV